MKRPLASLLAVLLIAAADPPAADIVAQRGPVKLTAEDVRGMLNRADPAVKARAEASPAALAAFVRDQVLDLAVLAEAKAKGWDQRTDVQQRANAAHDAVIIQTYITGLTPIDPSWPSDADVAAAYEANKTRLVVPKQSHLAQIAITVPVNAPKDVDDAARKKAQDLRAQVMKPNADFAEVAKKNSQEKATADKGGDLGWLREDDLVPPLREPISALAENGTSDVLRLSDGYHIVRLLGVKPSQSATLAEAKPQLVQAMRQARGQQSVRTHVDEMLREQPIQLNEIDLSKQVLGH